MESWVVIATQLIVLFVMVRKFSGAAERRVIEPQPLTVKAADEFSPKDHRHEESQSVRRCDARHQAESLSLNEIRAELKELRMTQAHGFKALNDAAEERSSKLHLRLDPIAAQATATAEVLENHLRDHRAARTGGFHAG